MVPAMLDVGVGVMPDRYKKRSISAIRIFPPGCGRAEVPAPETPIANGTVVLGNVVDPAEETSVAAGYSKSLEKERMNVNGVVDQARVPELQRRTVVGGAAEQQSVNVSKAEPDEFAGPSGSSKSVKMHGKPPGNEVHAEADDILKSAADHCATEKLDYVNGPSSVLKRSETSKELLSVLLDDFDPGISQLHGPSKRRVASAIRRFPSGCGRSAASMMKEESPRASTAASEEATGKQKLETVIADKQVCGLLEDGICREEYGGMPRSSMDVDAMEESKAMETPNKDACKKQEVLENDRHIDYHFPGTSTSNAAVAVEPSNGTSVALVDLEYSPIDDKNFDTQNIVKQLPKVGLKKLSKGEHARKKTLQRAVNKQASKSSSTKISEDETSDIDAKVQSQPCIVVEGTESKEVLPNVSKDKGAKSRSWIHSEMKVEGNSRNPNSPGKKSTNSDMHADSLIVQVLMAAPNCPWRQGRQMGLSFKDSASGNKPKKEVNIPKRKSLTLEASATQVNNAKKAMRISKKKSPLEKTFDDQLVDKSGDGADPFLLEDVGDERALISYPDVQELSVSLMPFGPSDSTHDGGNEEAAIRIRVRKVLRLFQVLCRKLQQCEESKPKSQGQKIRADLIAAGILKEKNEFVNTGKPIVGPVPGVEVGDEFHYRAELSVVGLHRPYQGGIDYTRIGGTHMALSIVASVGHADEMDSSDVLIYSGSGGSAAEGNKPAQDQKLERGNLSLKNCIASKTPVRVIRGFKELRSSGAPDGKPKTFSTFTYDGLYLVEDHWLQQGPQGFSVYKFKLRRIPGQPELALKEIKRTRKSAVREGLCIEDISEGKEKIPISVVNTVDDERPAHFEYITKMIYPSWYKMKPPDGCNCKRRCSDSEKCACSVKNGEIPFNFSGAIVQAKALVYECGPSCGCPLSCHNRVSQHGIKIRLEIFKTKSRGWGVRSLSSIASGSFICEYIGELIEDKEAEQRSNDEYLFDIGHNYDDHDLWEGLPSLMPDSESSSHSKDEGKDDETGFTIDAAKYGNVGRFINHSCSPNLYAQNILYDHDNKKMPHITFFAAENIPPLQELTYHYNYTINEVRDSDGNIKEKACHCGSHECTGRLY